MAKKKGRGQRQKTVTVKNAKKKSNSSVRWLNRQLNDPYVELAKKEGYRSRAAYKIIEINNKFKIFKRGQVVIDLGCAPGSWSQIVQNRIGNQGKLIGVDLLDIEPIKGMEFIKGDFLSEEIETQLKEIIDGKVDIIMSDMAANTTGHNQTDHIRTMALCEAAYDFAIQYLKEGGVFIAKTFRGGTEGELLGNIKKKFKTVRHFKPESSRKESPEMYIVAVGFKN